MKKIITSVVAVLAIGSLLLIVSKKLTATKKAMEAKIYQPEISAAVAIQADTIRYEPLIKSLSYTGSFSANKEVIVGSETSGKIIEAGIREGDHISAGQIVARIDASILNAQLQSAQASLAKAQNTVSRYEQAPSGVTSLQLDNAKTEILTGKAQVEQLKAQLRQYTITAPFAGVITSKDFELGTIVSPGARLATLTDISYVKLEINVPEKEIALFAYKQNISISTDVLPDVVLQGKVDLIAAKADASHNFPVKILVPNSKGLLRAGMYGTVAIHQTTSRALTLPRSALTGSSQTPQVYVIQNGVAVLRNIETGSGNESLVEVTSGLQDNEIVIVGGLVNVSNGTKVMVAN